MASVSTQKARTSSSSSSSSTPLWEHDVFLSFYGEDTRKNFTDHLYTSLKQKGINAYRDNEKLEQGTPIASGLMKAIEESKYAIIVISENYAFSKWCLNELVKILECMKDKGLRVLPVFYHVNPSDVGNQRKTFEKAFLKHKEDPEVSIEKIQKWRAALKEVSEICGRHLNDSYESEDIQEITKSIFYELNSEFPDFSEHLVGIHSCVMEMRNLFGTMSDDVHYIGIWGIPGIGKTTLANVIFNRIRHQFEASSFICNVRETVEKHDLVYLQKQLVSETLKVKEVNIWNHLQGIKVIKKGLLNKKVLIVIDDADKDEQLQALVGNRDWFGLGSRIIITSKDKHLLERHRVVTIHKVNGLDNDEALELFSWTVFNQTYPKKDFVDLSNDFLKYAKGIPLALKVLGSSLIGRPRKEWEDYLHQLEKIPEGEILDKLEISKRGLNDTEQNLFLDKNRGAHMEGFGCYKNIETLKDKIAHHKSPQELGKCDRDSQLEDNEQLALAVQESLYVENVESPPPRYGHRNIYQPMPMYYPLGSRICAGFYTEIGYRRYLNFLNAVWHPECFRCHSCNLPISDNEFSTSGNYPYHKACYKENYHPKCDVCKNFIPTNPAGLIEYRAHPFWIQKYCPFHEHDNTPRCCSCERMEPRDKRYVSLNDGRSLCLECLDTAVMDAYECQPLYLDILEFYEGLNMKVEQQVPLLLVERQALNEAREGEKNGHYHMPETRGLCLSAEQTISTARQTRNGAGKRNVNMVTELFRLSRHCEVTAILILYGLPRLLTGSILAHEMMHAWLRLKGYRSLSQDVEEGICQVLAHMWLSSKLMSGSNVASSSSSTSTVLKKGTGSQYEKKLGEFFKYQIESDISHVYGDGFRAGHQAVLKYGLPSVVKSALNGDGFTAGQQAVHKYGLPSVVKSAL